MVPFLFFYSTIELNAEHIASLSGRREKKPFPKPNCKIDKMKEKNMFINEIK